MKEKNLYIIAGCNGAGKTTASFTILPEILDCKEFVNADEIAKGLSPFQPEKVSFEAGRIMLNRIDELFEQNENFAFETTLATKTYKQKILKAQENGYNTTLLFFWLKNSELAKERVKLRESQRAWVKKKEKICVANEEEFGRESHFEAIACQTEMTKERILFLEKY